MGTRNHGFTSDARTGGIPMRPVLSTYARDTPATDLPPSYLHDTEEHAYLAPRVPGYNTDEVIVECQKENYYDALGKYSDEHKVEAMKRPNLCYEPAVDFKKKPKIKSVKKAERKEPRACCLPLCLVLVGFLALGAFTVTLLQFLGILKCGGFSQKQGASEGTTGKRANVIPSYVNDTQLTAKLAQLESNITTLKERILPQEQEIAKLQNASAANVKLITALQELLLQEQQKVVILNSTVSELNRLQKSLRSSTAVINETLSADISKLNKRLQAQDQKIDGLNYNNTIENLRTSIARESIYRQGNDSHLQSAILQNSVNRQISIANLSAELVALSAKISQDIASVERRFNTSISTHMIDVGRTDQNLYSQVLNVNETLLSLIKNISLTPGPVGPAGRNGSGNMSQCVETKSVISVGAGLQSYSMTKPPPGNVVVGLYCYASIPVGISFDEIFAPDGSIVKRCQCIATKIETNWKCIIHSWSCPRIS